MKMCPKCKCTVDAIAECPICGNDILNEPQSEREFEEYKLNKWFFIHLIKCHKFAIICTLIALFFIVETITSFSFLHILSLILVVYMWLEDLFKNLIQKLASWKYSDDYIESTNRVAVYLSGIMAVLAAFIPMLKIITL
jgi:hypothetical protein